MVRTSGLESPLLAKYEQCDPPSEDINVNVLALFSIWGIILLDNSKLPRLSSGFLAGIKGEQKGGVSKERRVKSRKKEK